MTLPPYPIPRDVTTPCANDPEAFFPDRHATGARLETAKRVCRACPFQASCLDYGLHVRDEGIWGGKTEQERAELRRRYNIHATRPDYGTLRGYAQPAVVPHGTAVGVEAHRKRYDKLCRLCESFNRDRQRRNRRQAS